MTPELRREAPVISVVIPTYNRAALIGRTIQSVLDQSFQDFEVIVVDDGSQDDTRAVVESFLDPRVRYIEGEHRGAAYARNRGVRASSGRYITFLDSDDEGDPRWLALLVEGFEEHGGDVVCCGYEELTRNGAGVKSYVELPADMGPAFYHAVGLFKKGGSFAMRREVFDAIGGYAPDLRSGQHTELALRLIPLLHTRGWTIYNVMASLLRIHLHPGPRVRTDPEAVYKGASYMVRVHAAALQKDPQKYANYLRVAGVKAMQLGRYREARKYLLAVLRIYPLEKKTWARLFLSLVPFLARRVLGGSSPRRASGTANELSQFASVD